jgi:thiamine monophosphate synthase
MGIRSRENSRTYKIIGATANTFEDVLAHVQNTANYIGLGPFQFTTIEADPILGLGVSLDSTKLS